MKSYLKFIVTLSIFVLLPFIVKAQRAVGDGSTDFFKLRTMGSTTKTNKIIPGTITITATGGQIATDDSMGNLYQSGVLCGWVDYQRDGVVIDFSSNPAAGIIVATYQNYNTLHSRGCWRKID